MLLSINASPAINTNRASWPKRSHTRKIAIRPLSTTPVSHATSPTSPRLSAQALAETQASKDAEPTSARNSAMLHRSIKTEPMQVVAGRQRHLIFSNGQAVLDSTCGAAVSCIGYGNERVKRAMIEQIDKFAYANSMFFGHPIGEELAAELIAGTDGVMSKAYIMCSGSEAMESAMKMARQYYTELSPKQTERVNFIARKGSYHGTTLGSLSMSGHVARRSLFEDMLLSNTHHVSPCNAYRGMKEGQTTEEYVEQLADELDRKFQELGPETVCAFVAEPVVGATLGCVPAVPGYFPAMKKVCEKYGALLILDEVMSGMGRSGTLHAWQQEGVTPDIQTLAKGLGGGYAPIAGMLINHRVADVLKRGSGSFLHGHTYQGHPVGCAAALEVQRIIREENLVDRVKESGKLLSSLLHEYLDDHPYVGNIRGKGLFWGIEFVADKGTKTPFPPSAGVANAIHTEGLLVEGISLYPGTGTKDGVEGDHVLLSPAYNSTKEEIEEIALKTRNAVVQAFEKLQYFS
ncbi:aminotransferase class-III [Stachybotrys elegans]|uniref:Aminotransferase class-III n=1 Tax=Stachybotrys elegans TaxID=80388 RepID=A0A8K0WPT2_9HYPO|nr:aminotransferase class-III [Stachybotrys elegans]